MKKLRHHPFCVLRSKRVAKFIYSFLFYLYFLNGVATLEDSTKGNTS